MVYRLISRAEEMSKAAWWTYRMVVGPKVLVVLGDVRELRSGRE